MAKKDTASQAEVTARAMEADPFEQPYWNLDQYLIWLASRDPAAVLKATDRRLNADETPRLAWRLYEENVDRKKVEMEAIRAIKGGRIKVLVDLNGESVTPDDSEWFEDLIIGGEPTLGALLVRTTKSGRRKKLRPRFNPQSIGRLYRAPTPSNIRDRPDVENPKVGVFISYYDVLNWLAERISLEESVPIDEAGSSAEEKIRYICMSAPEKLKMWGFRKGDPDAELKAVTPQAWQALSINPVAGQPETDLQALGYSRELIGQHDENGPGPKRCGKAGDRRRERTTESTATARCDRHSATHKCPGANFPDAF